MYGVPPPASAISKKKKALAAWRETSTSTRNSPRRPRQWILPSGFWATGLWTLGPGAVAKLNLITPYGVFC